MALGQCLNHRNLIADGFLDFLQKTQSLIFQARGVLVSYSMSLFFFFSIK
jgi:hypothetical protein